jgi:hypothetical protein
LSLVCPKTPADRGRAACVCPPDAKIKTKAVIPETFMKRLSIYFLILLGILSAGCSVQASGQTRRRVTSQSRASRKAENKQRKAMKKYMKAQKKAQRKMIKRDRKNTKLPRRQF